MGQIAMKISEVNPKTLEDIPKLVEAQPKSSPNRAEYN